VFRITKFLDNVSALNSTTRQESKIKCSNYNLRQSSKKKQSKSNFQTLLQSISRLKAQTADMRAKVDFSHDVISGLFPVTDAGLNTTGSEIGAVTGKHQANPSED
jgi:hypothetical protein